MGSSFTTTISTENDIYIRKCFFLFSRRRGFRNTTLSYDRVKKTLSRHKNKIYPRIPDSIENIREKFEDLKIMEKYGYNLESDSKFYIDTVVTSHYSFTVFASKFVIDFIEKNIEPASRKFLMDATFDSLPKDFYQLLIFSIEYQNDVSKVNSNHVLLIII